MKANNRLSHMFWRWHFYAGLFIAPLLIMLSLSGIGYLFKSEIEDVAYKSLYFGQSSNTHTLTTSQAITAAEQAYPGERVTKISYFDDESRNTRFSMRDEAGRERYVFVDRNKQIVGSMLADDSFGNIMRNLHSSLLVGGTVVNYTVELAACWAVFLIISGLYMSWKKRASAAGTKREKVKSRHTVIGIIFTIPLLILIVTGLPWSGFMGNQIYQLAASNESLGYPQLYVSPPQSEAKELPWATRKEKSPQSSSGYLPLSADDIEHMLHHYGVTKPFVLSLPADEKDVYTASKSAGSGITGMDVIKPSEEITAYFDQYSGTQIHKIDYRDYGLLAQWFTYGIPLHEGHLFGWPNQILCLLTVVALLAIVYWGVKMWWMRRPRGRLAAPPRQPHTKSMIGFYAILVILGLLMPLLGMSLIVIAVVELIRFLVFRGKSAKSVTG
ncbi:PepSY domain-containing protein [Paenibacillus alvei]|uniref:PepSY domain-containing protein n=1 Tax=Paenibacillus alvei TaxID=44250 RepID=A0ABT4GS83_PAEAL|nr:PepSY domain-containing protein [Paenibacillus alvei]EJW18631.1 sulfite reductase (NADPH), flavoprotein, alpha subunit [Paenibacillus alvei DSM 29]MCY9539796.1 PepSY domain-containing protein [Paenibacillus alvei]MCY9703317.1 PepSY domain-containing protein [Paenibacillus alvei]MCY9735461.1 PepSY domain-containing protein [Paenibacillus alvei]MCY9753057.1 PepSY domain-containing protein [Paenibacillus alvei]